MGLRSAERVEWQLRAACRGPQAAVFFPPPYVEKRDEKRRRELRAKDIWRHLLGAAPTASSTRWTSASSTGIWGGLNEVERRDLLLRTARA